MSDAKFKTMRHIETVRNFLNTCVRDLLERAELHDQSKLQSPEVEAFEIYTPKLRASTYGSQEYIDTCRAMKPAIDHHHANNRHHPEYHANGIQDMNLIDLVELICDWKAAGMRHDNGDLFKSIEINQKRFGYSDELAQIFHNTAVFLNERPTYHHANES